MRTSAEKNRRLAEARDYLKKLIGGTAPGDPLPSFRSILEHGQTTRAYLESALEHFAAAGEIEVVPRSGIYRSRKAEGPCRIVDVIACNERNYLGAGSGEFYPELLWHLYEEATRHNCAIRLHRIKEGEPLETYRRLAELPDSGGYFLIRTHAGEVVEWFADAGKPAVHIFSDIPLDAGCRLVDNPEVLPTVCERLAQAGMTRIAFLNLCDPTITPAGTSETLRKAQFSRFVREHGWEDRPEWNLYGWVNQRGTFGALETMFQAAAPEALIANDRYMPAIYHFLARRGLRPGRDISLAGYDGLALVQPLIPALTTLTTSRREMASVVWTLFTDYEKQRNRAAWVPCRWHEGESIAAGLPAAGPMS